jgi:hypothetical protein
MALRSRRPIPASAGWYDTEHSGERATWRWTDGTAVLALSGRRGVLDIEVFNTACYWLASTAACLKLSG